MSEHGSPFSEKLADKPPLPDSTKRDQPLTPEQVCAFLIDKKSRAAILGRTQEIGTARGEMYDVRDDSPRDSIEVKTGNGAVTSPERNIFTERMWGCTSLFIIGPDRKSLIHLTPHHSSLSYKETERGEKIRGVPKIVARILESVEPDQEKRKDLSVVIIGNIGTEEDGDYSYQTLYDDWGKVKQALQDEGVKTVRIVEAPLDETGVYHLSQTPDTLYLVGNTTEVAPSGNLMIHKSTEAIPIDLREQSDSLILHPQSTYAKEIERYKTMSGEEKDQEANTLEGRYLELYRKVRDENSATGEERQEFELISRLIKQLNV